MAEADSIQIISRALKLLDVLSRLDGPCTLAEIAELVALPKSTTHRLLNALAAENFVALHRYGRYSVGSAFMCIGSRSVRGGFLKHAEPDAKQLCEETGHTVYLAMLQHFEVIYMGRYPGILAPRQDEGKGPAFFSGPGRAMLAWTPWEDVLAHIEKDGIKPRTPYSNTDIAALQQELEETRRRGYSYSKNEYTVGVCSIGAPIFDYTGACIAGISLAVVMLEEKSVDIHVYAPQLLETAKAISERLGHVPSATAM